MSSDSEDYSSSEEEDFLSLDSLPPEVFLHICSFLSAKFVVNVLSNVCRRFKDLIDDEGIWKTRIFRKWPEKFPIVPDSIDDWKEACIIREEYYDLWKNDGKKMKLHYFKDAHFGAVNCCHLIEEGSMCLTAGRDGLLKLWDITQMKYDRSPDSTDAYVLQVKKKAHRGAWVWAVAYDEENKRAFSGGFDNRIRMWDISDFVEDIRVVSIPTPIVCMKFYDRLLISGCYGKIVNAFDPRLGPAFVHRYHTKTVVCVDLDEKYIFSGSEDKTVVVYDRRAAKDLAILKLPEYPLAVSYNAQTLYIGDVKGGFYVADPLNNFQLIKSYDHMHTSKLTSIQHSAGSLFTCSCDKTVKIWEPSEDPKPIAVLKTTSEATRISVYDRTLVCSNTDDSMSVWMPKEECA